MSAALAMMLNAKELNKLLSENTDQKLFKRWFLMTPNGTLLAYTHPTSVKELRAQAALVSMTWKESLETRQSSSTEDLDGDLPQDVLQTLTIETEKCNFVVRQLQPQLLLVLEGGIPPSRRVRESKTTPEGPGDPRYPTEGSGTSTPQLSTSLASQASKAGSSSSNTVVTVLQIQRRKLEVMAEAIMEEFSQSGFVMPEQGSMNFF